MGDRPHIVGVEDEAAQRHLLVDYLAKQNFRVSGVDGTNGGSQTVVGEARYILSTDDAGSAEFAVAVADDWQGLGLARALLARLSGHAQPGSAASWLTPWPAMRRCWSLPEPPASR
jgi:GNAT superfamily N-acetyltransferase